MAITVVASVLASLDVMDLARAYAADLALMSRLLLSVMSVALNGLSNLVILL